MVIRPLLVAALLTTSLATAAPLRQAKSTPIAFPSGRIARIVTGTLKADQATYTVSAKAGQTMVVNAVGNSPGFEVVATVMFPNGGQDGGKGTPNYVGKLSQTGTYKINVARNLMASTASSGSFVLEVVLY